MPRKADGTLSRTSKAAMERAYKVQRAIELRRAGLSWEEVAKGSGYATIQGAHNAVARHLAAVAKSSDVGAELLRAAEIDRLNALQTSIWDSARSGNLGAVDMVLDLVKERSRLLGLDRNGRAIADAAGIVAGAMDRDVAAQVVNVVLALADRLHFSPEQRVAAPGAIVAELEARGLIRPSSPAQLAAS